MSKKYNFKIADGVSNLYAFTTDNGINYEVKFKNSDYIFEGRSPFYIPTYELSITVALNKTGKNPPLDSRVPHTVAAIFFDFYKENEGQVVVFICDSSDTKQEVRRRKFNQWTDSFKGTEFVKFDVEIIDPVGVIYYNSIILRSDNPFRSQILDSFIELANEQTK